MVERWVDGAEGVVAHNKVFVDAEAGHGVGVGFVVIALWQLDDGEVGLLVDALPRPVNGIAIGIAHVATIDVISGVLVVPPAQHVAARTGDGVYHPRVEDVGRVFMVSHALRHTRLEDEAAVGVPLRGLDVVVVHLAGLRGAVEEAHGHVAGQVGAPFGHEHGEGK